MTTYPGADKASQWFAGRYPGSRINPNVIVLHTTEGTDWPSYSGGANAPTLTIKPDTRSKRFLVRQHFPLETSSRALKNKPGGVETNTLNAIQVELIGTCDPSVAGKFKTAGAIYWPQAPEWALRELGRVLAELHLLFPAIPLAGVMPAKWLAYPASYGSARGQRMTPAQWSRFRGVCGHQHVPENDHGDPGALPIAKVLSYATATAGPNRVDKARVLLEAAAADPATPAPRRARINAGLTLLPPYSKGNTP